LPESNAGACSKEIGRFRRTAFGRACLEIVHQSISATRQLSTRLSRSWFKSCDLEAVVPAIIRRAHRFPFLRAQWPISSICFRIRFRKQGMRWAACRPISRHRSFAGRPVPTTPIHPCGCVHSLHHI
jgi:hypothetical protein